MVPKQKPPDGKITEWTQPDQPIDPKKDRRIQFGCYGIAVSPINGSLWCSGIGVKDAKLLRIQRQPAAIKQSGSVCAALLTRCRCQVRGAWPSTQTAWSGRTGVEPIK